MTNKLFVAGLSYSLTDASLEECFNKVGKVLSAKVIVDRYTGQSKGFGFVEMSTEEEAKEAMAKLNNSTLDGRTIIVKEALPQENKPRFNNDHGGRERRGSRDNDKRSRRW